MANNKGLNSQKQIDLSMEIDLSSEKEELIEFVAFLDAGNKNIPGYVINRLAEIDQLITKLATDRACFDIAESYKNDFIKNINLDSIKNGFKIIIEIGSKIEGQERSVSVRVLETQEHNKNSSNNPKNDDTVLRVVFLEQGKTIYERDAFLTFIKCLEEFGEENIMELNYPIYGYPIIANGHFDKKHEDYALHSTNTGKFVVTNTSTKTKQEILYKIARKLGIKIKVETPLK